MLKKICLSLLFLCFFLHSKAAAPSAKPDSLIDILKINNQPLREKKLIAYIVAAFEAGPIDTLNIKKAAVTSLFTQYNIENKAAFEYFIDAIHQQRTSHLNAAENYMDKAIAVATINADHYLLFAFFTHLAFFQTYRGSTIEAVTSFGVAKKEAILLDDDYLQVLIDVNISDIYYRNNFFGQSLFYLNEADSIVNTQRITEQRIKNVINNNKAENYFRMAELDSLKKYTQILNNTKIGTYKLYIFKHRTQYYLSLLQHNYKSAIKQINALQKDSLYVFDNTDEQNLADAYYNAGMPDSAKYIINHLLVDKAQNNHPEIKYHLYGVLGAIAQNANDYKQAAYNYKMALLQTEDQIGRLTQVGNVSSQIKIDELQNSYVQKEATYQRQRLWLIFTVVVAVLTISIIAMSYRNTKQKQYYEKLLFTTKKEELAFINSHEVRRHLSNILGIIDVLKHSEDKHKEYLQAEEHLFCATKSLDEAIKNISEKLDN